MIKLKIEKMLHSNVRKVSSRTMKMHESCSVFLIIYRTFLDNHNRAMLNEVKVQKFRFELFF